MAFVFEGINAYVNRLIRKKLYAQIASRPLFWFITANDQSELNALIRARKNPNDNFKQAVRLGSGGMGLAQLEKTTGSVGCEFRYRIASATAGANVSPGGVTPTASVFSEDLFGTAETRWSTRMWALKIRESTFENAAENPDTVSVTIGTAVEEAMAATFDVAFAETQTQFWTGTLTSTQQNNTEWYDGIIGMKHWVSDGTSSGETSYTTVGRVDRTSGTGTALQSKVNTAAALQSGGVIPTTVPTLSMIRKLRTNNTYGGLANKDPNAGTLGLTTSDLWNVLADEAEGQHTIYEAGQKIPETSMTVGSQFPVIAKDTTYITYDPDCASGEFYLLTPGSFLYEVQGGNNYAVSKWVPKHLTEEGGQRYRWCNITLKHRFTCTQPWLNSKCINLTTT